MKIGIIGLGVVGRALEHGFQKLGHRVYIHDIKYETKLLDLIDCEIVYICVPTPQEDDGRCDTAIVESVLVDLSKINYAGHVCVKSTVVPGTTEKMIQKYGDLKIAFVPEFLRERCAEIDFVENHDVCIIGTYDDESYNIIKKSHGKFPKKFIKLTPTEAELTKYFNNVYNSTLITFANSFYEICKSLGVEYINVKDAIVNRENISDIYLDCNENLRGFGGMCLPKDTSALAYLARELNLDIDFFDNIIKENTKYKITVFRGMRK
jgi:UDPglucose 6-dehydrogenase